MTTEEAIWAMNFYKTKLYNGIFNQYVDAFDVAIHALRAQQETERQGPCSRCGYGGKHLEVPPCMACPAYPRETKNNAQPPTNADRIRAMSDEALAEFFEKVHEYPCEACCNNLSSCRRNNALEPVCKRHYLDWLQQPAKEDDHA